MLTTMSESGDDAVRLRDAMVDALCGKGGVSHDRRVEGALRAVPRHVFVPEATLEEAYENQPIVTKKDDAGLSVSSISQPSIVAVMLEELAVAPGHRVLEIGAGTGYNAALLRHLVGPTGAVTTVDIDADIVQRAGLGLAAAGFTGVGVQVADGWHGWPADAPYDRIILTVGAADLSPVWWEQLVDGGVLVLPLQLRGSQRLIAFEQVGDHWASRSVSACGFIPMRGVGAQLPLVVSVVDDGPSLWVDPTQPIDADALRAALAMPSDEVPTGIRVGVGDLYDRVDLFLALTLDGFGRLGVRGPHESFAPALPWGSPALIAADSFAYLGRREQAVDAEEFELSVRGHGPDGARLAEALADAVRTWDRDRAALSAPTVRAYPAGTPAERMATGATIEMAHARVVVSWAAEPTGPH